MESNNFNDIDWSDLCAEWAQMPDMPGQMMGDQQLQLEPVQGTLADTKGTNATGEVGPEYLTSWRGFDLGERSTFSSVNQNAEGLSGFPLSLPSPEIESTDSRCQPLSLYQPCDCTEKLLQLQQEIDKLSDELETRNQ
ncbi:hypothetical protein AJ80_09495 [Polytolypa hystricis UAMH7299]|uniref:Uncharacterized protein n=1 Tax=Polytolypa hystricis (strain UAMH7299) TaxID=1447883 RepID=A0A2B7WQ01_POLH7|nr:hypothetical protein AJ80_09495 [Polytolypa hystricis UAMH7299]